MKVENFLTKGPEFQVLTLGLAVDRGTQRLLDAALASSAENGSAAELGSAGIASALPPRYVDFKEAIRTEMLTIKQKMNDLRSLHGKAALTSFDDSGNHEMDIEVLTQDITRLFRKAEVRLQQFGQGACTSEADEKVRKQGSLSGSCRCTAVVHPTAVL